MSKVRLLVGTRKGAFVMTADGTRDDWDVRGPALHGLGDVPPQGLAGRPGSPVRVAVHRLVRPGDPALRRRRQELGAGRQRVRVRRRPRHAPVVRRHPAPVGVRARLAPGAVARRPRHRLRGRRGRGALQVHGRRPDLEGALGPAQAPERRAVAAGRGRAVPAHDPDPPRRPEPDRHRDLGGGRVPHGRRRRDVDADQQGPPLARAAGRGARGRPLRPPHRDEPVASRTRCSCRSTGT